MPDNTTITLPLDEMRVLMGKAILDSLSAEAREKLLQEALNYLLVAPPTQRGYGEQKSPIQYAFDEAVRQLATEIAQSIVAEQKPKIIEAVTAMLEKLEGGLSGVDGWELQSHLAGGIIGYIQQKERERADRGY